jgi:integrase
VAATHRRERRSQAPELRRAAASTSGDLMARMCAAGHIHAGKRCPVRLDRLAVQELRLWRAILPAGSAGHIVGALRQVLNYAVSVGLLDTNPAKGVPATHARRPEILPFLDMDQVEAVAAELLPHYRAIPLLGCLTGLRPSELLGLERRDIDREGRLLYVQRVLVGGNLRSYGKTHHSLRVVPMVQPALDALASHPMRIDTPLLFSTKDGTPIDLHRFRARHWTPALRAAGLDHRGPYAMRHTFRVLGHRRRSPHVRDRGDDGHQPGAAERHLRPSAPRLG